MKSTFGLFFLFATTVFADSAFLRALAPKNCPNKSPLDSNSQTPCTPGLVCGYGEESCCGETFDAIACECIDGGEWICRATDACLAPPCEQCPASEPTPGGQCTLSDPSKQCAYGSESCCGETLDSFICTCDGGIWACFNTDACLVLW